MSRRPPHRGKSVRRPRPDTATRSVSGHRQTGGQVAEDPNPGLRGQQWVKTCQDMKLDGRLRGSWRALKHTLLTARFEWSGKEGNSLSMEAADYLNGMFGWGGRARTMDRPFEKMLAQILDFIPLGWRYSEVRWKKQPDGSWGIGDLLDCQPSAHYQWVPLNGEGPLEGVRQLDPNGNQMLNAEMVPADKLVLFNLDAEGDNPEGMGLFRSCWFSWALKRHSMDQMAIGVERTATGIPAMEYDRRALEESGLTPAQIDGEGKHEGEGVLDQARDAVANMAAGEEAHIVYPKGIKFEVLYSKGFDPAKLRSVVDLANEEMLTVFLNAFLMLGQSGSGGSYSLGSSLKDLFTAIAFNILQGVMETIGGPAGPGTGPVGRVLDWHPRFSALSEDDRPSISIDGLDTTPFEAFMERLPGLIEKGAVTPWDGLERWLLRKAGAPALPTEMERSPQERMTKDALAAQMVRNAAAGQK